MRFFPAAPSAVGSACREAGLAFMRPFAAADRAALLNDLADRAHAHATSILALAARETGYSRVRLRPELARMIGTLRLFAQTIEAPSWSGPMIDRSAPAGGSIGPNHDVRRMLIPLGPVAVFGASNFPLAYGVLGGDTASALAAGCPVVVKGHPLHPGTGECLAQLACQSLRALFGPERLGWFGFLQSGAERNADVGRELVTNPAIAAVGFTGSRAGGLALAKLAASRPAPIPVFAEMGSANITVIAPHAGSRRAEQIAEQLATSILTSSGQQCTKPGQLLVPAGEVFERVQSTLRRRFERWKPRALLGGTVASAYRARLAEVEAAGRDVLELWQPPFPSALSRRHDLMPRPAIITRRDLPAEPSVSPGDLTPHPAARDEIFGPAAVLTSLRDPLADISRVLPTLDPCLAISLYADDADLATPQFPAALLALSRHTGRLVFNGVTTGVRVTSAMVHGGPFPCTNRPESTAVGPLAMERWCRPVCFQNAPASALFPKLRD